jgi:hypothetical protein
MKYLSFLFLFSCIEFAPQFEREEFENEWWEIEGYSMCFNFHESGDLLSYQDQILEEGEWGQFIDEGEWAFHTPNEYSVLDKSIFAYENEECWEIEEYFDNRIITACECTLLNIGE